jgi:hypothetical protein
MCSACGQRTRRGGSLPKWMRRSCNTYAWLIGERSGGHATPHGGNRVVCLTTAVYGIAGLRGIRRCSLIRVQGKVPAARPPAGRFRRYGAALATGNLSATGPSGVSFQLPW